MATTITSTTTTGPAVAASASAATAASNDDDDYNITTTTTALSEMISSSSTLINSEQKSQYQSLERSSSLSSSSSTSSTSSSSSKSLQTCALNPNHHMDIELHISSNGSITSMHQTTTTTPLPPPAATDDDDYDGGGGEQVKALSITTIPIHTGVQATTTTTTNATAVRATNSESNLIERFRRSGLVSNLVGSRKSFTLNKKRKSKHEKKSKKSSSSSSSFNADENNDDGVDVHLNDQETVESLVVNDKNDKDDDHDGKDEVDVLAVNKESDAQLKSYIPLNIVDHHTRPSTSGIQSYVTINGHRNNNNNHHNNKKSLRLSTSSRKHHPTSSVGDNDHHQMEEWTTTTTTTTSESDFSNFSLQLSPPTYTSSSCSSSSSSSSAVSTEELNHGRLSQFAHTNTTTTTTTTVRAKSADEQRNSAKKYLSTHNHKHNNNSNNKKRLPFPMNMLSCCLTSRTDSLPDLPLASTTTTQRQRQQQHCTNHEHNNESLRNANRRVEQDRFELQRALARIIHNNDDDDDPVLDHNEGSIRANEVPPSNANAHRLVAGGDDDGIDSPQPIPAPLPLPQMANVDAGIYDPWRDFLENPDRIRTDHLARLATIYQRDRFLEAARELRELRRRETPPGVQYEDRFGSLSWAEFTRREEQAQHRDVAELRRILVNQEPPIFFPDVDPTRPQNEDYNQLIAANFPHPPPPPPGEEDPVVDPANREVAANNAESAHIMAQANNSRFMISYPFSTSLVYRAQRYWVPGMLGNPVHIQIDYINCLVPDLKAISQCSFYWGKMDRYEAERLLEGKPEGTFLLRDSAQDDHLFSVSFRRFDRSLHARIEHARHRFSFDSHDPGVYSSTTVTELIEHYKDPAHCMFFEPMLTKPLNRNFAFTLQHLARVSICDLLTYDSINELPLPGVLKSYLKEYHYRQKVRTKHFDDCNYVPGTNYY